MKSEDNNQDLLQNWSKFAKVYDPIKCASIDGTDILPHDRAVERALKSTYRPNRFVKGHPQCTIFVSRLNHETTKDTIKEIFSKYGKLKRFRMVKDIVTGMPKGYAFVEYEEERAAEDAYRLANKMVVDGNVIFVDFECERLLKGWIPRRLGGGFGGKKESGQLRFGGRDRPFKKPIALEIQEEEEKKAKEKERRRREPERKRHRDRRRSPGNGSSSPGRRDRDSPPRKMSRRRSPPKETSISSERTAASSSVGRREHPFQPEGTRHRDHNDHSKYQSREPAIDQKDRSPDRKGHPSKWEETVSPNRSESARNNPSGESRHHSVHNDDGKYAESQSDSYSQNRRSFSNQKYSPPRSNKFYSPREKRRSPVSDSLKKYSQGARRH